MYEVPVIARTFEFEEMVVASHTGMKYDKNVWEKTLVARIQEYGRRQRRNGFGINEREQQYVHGKSQPNNKKYGNVNVGARVILMVRGYYLLKELNGSMIMNSLCVCVWGGGIQETEIHVLFECQCYDMVR